MNLKKRIEALENQDGFKSESQRREYLEYARKIDPDISSDNFQSPDDYIRLVKDHFEPLPSE